MRSHKALTRFIVAFFTTVAFSQGKPPASSVPDPYRQKFVRYVDNRTIKEAMLNYVGLTGKDVGRSFALIAGVAQYPNMPEIYKTLSPAAADIDELTNYLINQEMFDEVVVLKDGDMSAENLRYFMEVYFPDRLQKFPKSRFLFAYSGHGIALGSASDPRGFILTSAAKNFIDTEHAINMATLRLYMDELADAGYQTLALINACHSGVFLRSAFGGGSLLPKEPGAHAITAGGSDQRTWSDPHIGRGSIFFEELLSGLGGKADLFPVASDGHRGDGIITVEEIATYLRQEVSLNTGQSQTPILTDLKRGGSNGGFFFLNRQRMVDRGFIPAWDPERNTSFGAEAVVTLKNARDLYTAGNYDAAFPIFNKAAQDGNGEAARYVGFMYEKGSGTKADYAQAVSWYRKAADAGDPRGMTNLGVMYENGRGGLAADPVQAVFWYRKAADAGDARGITNLGVMYEKGQGGLAADPVQAVSWYRKAADAGDARGMTNLGVMCEHGRGGLAADPVQALSWYRKAADAGDERGMTNLGVMYENGRGGLAADPVQAVSWYRKAADAGDALAMAYLGVMYELGRGGLAADPVQAVSWYRKAAEAGDEDGMTDLGVMYEFGSGGLAVDLVQALSWYRKAADAGDPRGMSNLGVMYEKGRGGLAADPVQAVFWYRKAADAGYVGGMTNLGFMYESGRGGLAADPAQAVFWYRKAAEAGYARGMTNLGVMYENGRGVLAADPAQAVFWYRKAADAGDARGMSNLGVMYEKGRGGLAPTRQAVSWYRKAAGLGYAPAIQALDRLGRK